MAHQQNNFDALRLSGALLVALGHTMDIVLGYDGLGAATNNQSFGGLGLNIFCTISGFLIMRSRMRNPAAPFFRARALRIFPALFIAIPLMALVLGPMVSTLTIGEYFHNGETWRFLATIFGFPLNPILPGVFGHTALVGQLYSLTAELSFYILVGLMGGWKHFPKFVAVALIVVWAVFLRTDYQSLPFSHIFSIKAGQLTTFFYPVRLGTLCVLYLFVGASVAILAPEPRLLTRIALCLLPIWLIALYSTDRRVYDMVEMSMLPLVVLGLGVATRFTIKLPEWLGDVSYGIYIYHFATAELVYTVSPPAWRGWSMILACLVISTLFGWISFQLVEKRALARKAGPRQAEVADVSVAARAATHSIAWSNQRVSK
ncbi:acyltransferase [Luteibacter sp. ME-Dv--P-043b]|uniref:acyltransferase family protein n=1 Tax=Luteibacter sp. ME-Dv--P-043b TaxID=3040291 RepID=UPI002555F4EF|nr:acyltransferase [Luteibacter sp. ME-Dv--P-043b]